MCRYKLHQGRAYNDAVIYMKYLSMCVLKHQRADAKQRKGIGRGEREQRKRRAQ